MYNASVSAQIWNKPKVEETFSIHNMPGGIPLDFLKQLIPDAITIEVDVDDYPKFTQEGSRVLLGVNRKSGDHILKLFSQVYINRHCLVLSRGRINEADAPNLKEILSKQMEIHKNKRPFKELKARARDINSSLTEKSKKKKLHGGTEVLMQVDNVPDADKVLTGRAGCWKGPSTMAHLKQAGPIKPIAGQPDGENPQQDLSDISEGSDICEAVESRKPPVAGRGSKPRSVKSGHKESLSLKEKVDYSRGSSKDSFGNLSDRARKPQRNIDSFGRSQEIRNRYVNVEGQQKNLYPQRIVSGQEKLTPEHGDLRHFITVQKRREESEKFDWKRKKMDDLAFKRNAGKSERNEVRRSFLRDSADRASAGRKSPRYSPETEWMLSQRDQEKNISADHLGKGDRERRSQSPSPRLDSKDRFRRLVEEKLRGFVDLELGSSQQRASNFTRGRDRDENSSQTSRQRSSRERDFDSDRIKERERGHPKGSGSNLPRSYKDRNRSPELQRLRARSPLARQIRRRTSASPVRKVKGFPRDELLLRKERDSKGLSKMSQSQAQNLERRVTIVRRKSLSPVHRRHVEKGRSSLSPISIGDDDEDDDKRSRGEVGRKRAKKDSEWLFKLSGYREENKPTLSKGSSGTKVSASSAGADPDDTSNLQREVLQEFVKQLLENANLSTSSAAADSSVNSKATDSISGSMSSHHNHQQHHHQQQSQHTTMHHSQSQSYMDTLRQEEPKTMHTEGHMGEGAPIPPPIPPPIMPPLYESPAEKMSHLESLAQQLAEDIQRQQPQQHQGQQPQELMNPPQQQQYQYQEPQHLSDGMWSAPPSLPAPTSLAGMQPPHLMLNAPPPSIAFTAPPMPAPQQPVVPLPFFSNVANQIRLQAMSSNSGQIQNPATNVYHDTNLNPHGNFF